MGGTARFWPLVWLLGLSSCFTGDATIGGFCERVSDCGPEQGCTNSVCGRCGNGERNPGEVCLAARVDVVVPEGGHVVGSLDLDADGSTEMFVATAADEVFGFRIATLEGEDRFVVTDLPSQPLAIATLRPHGDQPPMLVVLDAEQLNLWTVGETLRPIATVPGSFRAVAPLSQQTLAIIPNDGSKLLLGTVQQATETEAPLTLAESNISIGSGARLAAVSRDVGDEVPALAVFEETGRILLLARSDAGQSVKTLAELSAGAPIQDLILDDIDGDAAPDVVMVRDQRVVARSAPRWDTDIVLAEALTPRVLAISDIDHDGAPDLLVASTAPRLYVTPQRAAEFPFNHALTLRAVSSGVVVGDLDRDFRLEVLTFHDTGWSTFSEEP